MAFVSKTGEPVNEEAWQWVAIYGEDSMLKQFDYDTETYHYFAEIKAEYVKKFGLVNQITGKSVFIDVPEKAKLIHFYSNIIQSPLGGEQIRHRLFSFGFELGKTKKILTVLPNDFIIEVDPDKIGVL